MKKMALLLLLAVSFTVAFGQKNVRQTASNYLKEGKLDKALEAINQCVQDPTTAQDAKSWFLRGNVYLEISNSKDEKYKALDPDPVPKAIESYKKAIEYDTKKEYFEDIFAKLNWQRNNHYNQAVDLYSQRKYKEAANAFEQGADVIAVANVTDTLALNNAAICANMANEKEQAKEIYLKLLKGNYKSPFVYMSLSDIYRQEKDSVNALKYVKMGQQLYPANLQLFLAETNIYLTFGKTDKALRNLQAAIQKDSSNPSVYFALGTIYDNLSNDTLKPADFRQQCFEYAAKAYKDAVRLNPNYFEPNYNLGALYVNKAALINDIANKLPLDATAEFDKLKKEADKYLEDATPYLEKASELQPNDLNTLYSLKQIYARLNKMDKLKAINVRLDQLQKK